MATSDLPAATVIDGRRLRLTSLKKVMYPETGTSKQEVLAYYAAVAPFLVPHTRMRPATRKRFVDGVGTHANPGTVFFEKNLPSGVPSWVARRTMQHSDRPVTYPLINDAATLVWCAQLGALELHVPQWTFVPDDGPNNPDRLVLDLDPGPGADLDACVEVALLCRTILDEVGLLSIPVTSGSKGIHLYARLDGSQTSQQASEFAKALAVALEADHPKLIVSDMKKSLRGGKVLLDWSQNNAAKTTIAPYSLRGTPHPRVACPRSWDEIKPGLQHLEMYEVLERLQEIGDPLADLAPTDQSPSSASSASGAAGPQRSTASGGSGESVGSVVIAGTTDAAEQTDSDRSAGAGESADGGNPAGPAESQVAVTRGPQRSSTALKMPGTYGERRRRSERPAGPLRPMQASTGTAASLREPGWAFEVKWDGYRALVELRDGRCALTSRNGIDLTPAYPELQQATEAIAAQQCVLDGEIVALDEQGRPQFSRLQERAKSRSIVVHLMLFDALEIDGESLLDRPYQERREALETLVTETRLIHVPPQLTGTVDEALQTSRSLQLEGIVAKRTDGKYLPGARSASWMKVKHVRTQDVVIIGWNPGGGNRSGTVGSLLMAIPHEADLKYVGKVGSGFTDRGLRDAERMLTEIERRTPPVEDVPGADAKGARWVDPVYVGEVSYSEQTESGRLRHPVWKGWRPDKSPDDVGLEQRA